MHIFMTSTSAYAVGWPGAPRPLARYRTSLHGVSATQHRGGRAPSSQNPSHDRHKEQLE